MAIEQHPIPQDVAGYKFRLIGEMTIKQFAFLAGGIIAGLIVYSLPLPFFFKYPLAAAFVMLGAGIAFLPVEGRPMDKWLIAFIKSIYSPTEYVWQKEEGVTEVTMAKITPPVTAPRSEAKIPPPMPVTVSAPKPEPPPVAPPKPAPLPVPAPVVPKASVSPISVAPPAATLPIPFTPTIPNTLVGMTLTPESKILDGCLIEIKSKGISLRATKSNQLGQFLFAKPLENGLYQISIEKPGFTFDTYSLELTGRIIKPLKLQAKMANSK